MIPLANVRAMLAAATPGPWRREREDGTIRSSVVVDAHDDQVADATGQAPMRDIERRPVHEVQRANAALIAAAPDLGAQVLTLATALETAERERDEARTDAARLRGEVEGAHRAASHARQERTVMAEELTTVREARDTARSALDELAAAVATVRDARAVVAAASAQYNAAWDAASAPPTASDCEAVAVALRASYEAGDALSAALDALLARCP